MLYQVLFLKKESDQHLMFWAKNLILLEDLNI
jgi:hypothetical protein